jgi:hypothetical protein
MKKDISRSFQINNNFFKFDMNNHLKDRSVEGVHDACEEIADWIIYNADKSNWIEIPNWFKMDTSEYRFVRIDQYHPLWHLLDKKSQKTKNWLIFKYNKQDKTKIKIIVTHFGPLGTAKNQKFEPNYQQTNIDFKNDYDQYKHDLNDVNIHLENEKKIRYDFFKKLDDNYIKAMSDLQDQIDSFIVKLKDLVYFIFGTTIEAGVLITKMNICLGPSAIKICSRIFMKEIISIISKEFAKKIALITAKISSNQTGKIAVKKVPAIGFFVGIGLGSCRLLSGDFSGAVLEVASGAASTFPGSGTVCSYGIDSLLLMKDVKNALDALMNHERIFKNISYEIDSLTMSKKEIQDEHNFFRNAFIYEELNDDELVEQIIHLNSLFPYSHFKRWSKIYYKEYY